MNTKLSKLFAFVLVISLLVACAPKPVATYEQAVLACGGPGNLAHYDKDGFDCKDANTGSDATEAPVVVDESPVTSTPTSIPAPEAKTLTMQVDGKDVILTADASGAYFYATTIDGKSHSLSFILPANYSWAMDADDAMGVARQNALDDVLLFGDQPNQKYDLWGVFAAGIKIAPMGVSPDLAGPALRDRVTAFHNAGYQCPRPVYYMANDTLTNVSGKVDPFKGICGN